MTKQDKGRLSSIVLVLSFIAILAGALTYSPTNILSWDTLGYYLYLPLIFIYNDLGMKDVQVVQDLISQYQLSGSFYQAWLADTGFWVIKYTSGEAILLLPFFLIGHLLTLVTGGTPDGFSVFYQYSIWAGCLCYLLVSLILLRKILLHFFNDRIAAFTLLCVLLGTNYYIQAASNPAVIHLILFFLYTLLIYTTIKWHEQPSAGWMATIAITAGLTIITRPTDVICLIIPFLYNIYSKETLKQKFTLLNAHKWQLLMAAVIVIGIGCLQLRYWKFATGHWLINSYNNPGEGMDFLTPHLWQVLFSFRKGWYLYTPIMLLATVGIYFTHKLHREMAWPITIFFLCNLYLVACWSCWWYAGSFSQRAFIQSYPLMAIALGSLIQAASNAKLKLICYGTPTLLGMLILFNLFQSWQYNQRIIDPERMTREAYFANFFATKHNPQNDKLLLVHRSADAYDVLDSSITYRQLPTILRDFEDTTQYNHLSNIAHSGLHSCQADSAEIFVPACEIPYQDITSGEYAWVHVTAWIYPTCDMHENPGSMVITFNHNGGNYKYRALDLEGLSLTPHEWNKIEMNYLTPEPRQKIDLLQVYYWHRGKQPVYVDDICIDIQVPAK